MMMGSRGAVTKEKDRPTKKMSMVNRFGWGVLVLAILVGSAGCGEVKPLTPEQQSLVSAWSIGKSLQKAFTARSSDAVMELLSPSFSEKPQTRGQLERLFTMFDSLDLHLVMDSGIVDSTSKTVTFMAHWTLTGIPKEKTLNHYFQTGECQMIVTLREAPHPSKIESLTGDSFMMVPAKPGPPS